MKILVANIPDEGLNLDLTLDKETLKGALDDSDELKGLIEDSLKCKCHLRSFRDEIFINGELSVTLKPTCFRCNSEYRENIKSELELVCVRDKHKKNAGGRDYMDGDLGINFYTGEEIDLGKIAAEQVFLTLPMKFLCKENCAGLCTGCGADLNKENCRCQEKKANNQK